MANGARDDDGIMSIPPIEREDYCDAQVIEPEQFTNDEIYRIYLSANPGIAKFRDAFRTAILNEGDLVIECCDRKVDLAKIMGRIKVADAVIIAVNEFDSLVANHNCKSCVLNGVCDQKSGGNCSKFISEFEYLYAKLCNKDIRFIFLNSSNDYAPSRDGKIENMYEQMPDSIKRMIIIDNKDALE